MQRLAFEGKNKKVESCFAPSGHKGVERFEPRLTQPAYFGERFREGNIRYNETFTDRPSFQPPLSFASMEDILTETFLQVVIMSSLDHARATRQDMRRKTLDLVTPFFWGLHIEKCLFSKSFCD